MSQFWNRKNDGRSKTSDKMFLHFLMEGLCACLLLSPCYQVPATAEIPYQRFLNRYTWANTHIDIVKVFMWWQCVFSNCASWKTLLHHKSCTDLGATMFGSFHSYGVFDIPVLVFVHRHLCNWPVMLLWCHSCAMEGKKKTNSSVFIKHPPGINSKHCKCFLY